MGMAASVGIASMLALAFAVTEPGVALAQSASDDPPAEEAVEEIVVTAQRREQNLQRVPIAISAFGGETIASLGLDSSSDLSSVVPNVQIGLPAGEGNQPLIFIRGVGLSDTNSNNSGPNGVYVDDVYISSPGAQTFQIFDLDRVEVLRGPQGTLYGRNATGGAINFISVRPSQDLAANASVSFASFETVRFEGGIGGPLTENVRARLSGTGARSSGYINNLLTGGKENAVGSFALRGQLDADLGDNLEVRINLHGGKVDTPSAQQRSLGVLDPATGFTTPCSVDAIQADQCGNALGYVSPPGYYDGNYNKTGDLRVDNLGGSVRFDWSPGNVTLTSISAYDFVDRLYEEETDSSPLRLLEIDYGVKSDTFSQELRIAGRGERLNWVLGGYHLNEVLLQNQTIDLFGELRFLTPAGGADTAGVSTGGAPVLFARARNRQTTDASALFGQVEYSVLPSLRLTLGGRYNNERKTFLASAQLEDATIDGVSAPGEIAPVYAFARKRSFDNVSFRVGLDYDIAKRILGYVSVSSGFKSGGFNGGFLALDPTAAALQAEPYAEETLLAYEAGLKSTLFDGRLRLNAAVFQYDYQDLQVFTLVNTGVLPVQLLSNAANASIIGGELELVARPVSGLDISLNLGLLDTEIKDFVSAGNDLSGNQLALSPRVSFSGQANYELPLIQNIVAFVQPSFSYRSEQFFSADNNPLVAQEGYWLANARIGVKSESGHWEAAAFGRNLTRQRYDNYAVDLSDFGFINLIQGEPRLFGVELKFRH
jgi:iron complex outermembrane recepter protein